MELHPQVTWGDQIKIGSLQLQNRVVMSALTRQRCPQNGVPTQMVAQYYSQRGGAAIIFTQTTAWCQRGRSSVGSANLYTEQQAQGWKKVIEAVHKNNAKIFVQINHAGRATNPQKTQGLQIWAPSSIACRQKVRYLQGKQAPKPKEMTLQDIQTTKQQFRISMKLAKKAGFDGIQLQGAHGYLIDQFLRSSTNERKDKYGGSVENRCRYCLQLFDIALQFYLPEQLAIKLSPVSRAKDMFDANPEQTFGYLLKQMSKRNIGFAQIRQSTEPYAQTNHYGISSKDQIQNVCRTLRPYFNGILIGNDSFNAISGLQKIKSGDCDMISFGQFYIVNPDLAERLINGWQIVTTLNKGTFYGNQNGAKGYTDYKKYQIKKQ